MAEKRTILVAGAFGRQGRAFVAALTSSQKSEEYHILALTRKTSQQKAQTFASEKVTIVEGNLDDAESIRKIFQSKGKGGIWGVFCVLAFPGLGANADGEEKQGKTLADVSLEFGVSHFVLSTVERGGEDADDTMMDDRLAKIRIERHVKELGQKGLKWTFLHPGFFMENYEGGLGSLTFGVLKAGLKSSTTIQLIAVDDIGKVASGVFNDPSSYESQVLVVVGDIITMSQQEESYRKATGRAIPSVPAFLARTLISINAQTKQLISDMEHVHDVRSNEGPSSVEYRAQLDAARRAYPHMKSFEEWAQQQHDLTSNRETGWNNLSLWKILRGKQ